MSEKIDNIVKKVIAVVGIIFGIYHIVVLNFVPRPAMAFRSFHLLLVLLLTFLIYPTFKPKEGEKKSLGLVNLIFIVLSIASVGYAYFNIENILLRGGIFTTQMDIIMGLITLLCVLEATRRTNGAGPAHHRAAYSSSYAFFGPVPARYAGSFRIQRQAHHHHAVHL